jgi:hypothetical protein
MAGHLMVLNPKRKRRRKMSALQRKYFGNRRRKRKSRAGTVIIATSNPKGRTMAKRRRRHRRRFSSNPKRRRFLANPRRHHRRRHHHRRHFRSNPIFVKRRRFRRNPVEDGIMGALVPAGIGAVGAVGVDVILGNLPLPATLRAGWPLAFARIGAALLLGAAFGAAAGEEFGNTVAAGGIVVTMYQLLKGAVIQTMPNVRMARYRPMGRYLGRAFRSAGAMNRVPRFRLRGLGLHPGVGPTRLAPHRLAAIRRRRHFRGLGYIGPARTVSGMGRYLGQTRNARR